MRIVTWNLGNKTKEKAIPARFFAALDVLKPDILALNEFVEGKGRPELLSALASRGFTQPLWSDSEGSHNRVLVASRELITCGELPGVTGSSGGRANFLHVKAISGRWEFVGFRAVAYEKATEKRAYWEEMRALIRSTAGRAIIWAGDANAGPTSKSPGGDALRELVEDGWQLPEPAGAWSFKRDDKASSRIDHALLSRAWPYATAAYFTHLDGKPIAGPGRGMVSDHAALVVDVPLP